MDKKAMVSPVFKYIFALIVGTMFLLFFIRFGMNYMKQQGSIEAYRLTSGFDDVLSILGSSTDADQDYNLGTRVNFKIYPDKEGKNRYLIKTSSSSKSIKSYKILFTPEKLSGKKLYILTKRWYFPFGVTNFYYLTNARYKYFVVYDDDTEEFANELAGDEKEYTPEIPNKFGVMVVHKNKLKVSELKKQVANVVPVFVLLGEDAAVESKLKKIENAKVRVVNFDDGQDYGEVLFEDGDRYPFMKLPILVGAIFAEDSKNYKYSLDMALDKLGVISKIYNKKKTLLENNPNFFSCSGYTLIGNNLETMISLARNKEYDYTQYENLVQSLENNNELLGGDCPEIF
jgi:hypothetical protein